MIGFLYPLFGLAALAIAIPVLLHLVRRREHREQSFPALRYLRRAEQRHASRLRFRHLLLLGARVAIVALAAAAAAGLLLGRGDAADHRPTALAIIVDESQSSALPRGEVRTLDSFVERALLTLGLATGRDRVALFSAVLPQRGPLTTDVAGARAYLGQLEPAAGAADLAAALRQAELWLAANEGFTPEIHLLTDLQRTALARATSDPAPGEPGTPHSTVVVFAPEAAAVSNGAVGDPQPAITPLSAGRETRISVPLIWYGDDRPPDSVTVRLVSGSRLLGVAEGRFSGSATLRLPPQESGWLQGHLEIPSHGLIADDRRHFTWMVQPVAQVSVLGEPGRFLTEALEALERDGRLRRTAPAEADVWLAASAERLPQGLAAGRSVVVLPPADRLDLPRTNDRLARAGLGWTYRARPPDRGTVRIASGAPVPGLSGSAIRDFYDLLPAGPPVEDSTLVRLDTGEPWLLRGRTAEGALFLLFASPLSEQATDVPRAAAMVPLIDALVGDWARGGAIATLRFEGPQRVPVPTRAREVRFPDGSSSPIEGGAFIETWRPGNYAALADGQVTLAFSVNAPLAEADLARASRAELEAVLPAARWAWTAADEVAAWRANIFQARRGRHAWRPLVVLILLVSIVEASLAATGRRGQRPARTAQENATT